MSRSESVELARFLIQRRFAKKDALLAAGRDLRKLQAQGVRTPFLDYLLESRVIDRKAYDAAKEAFSYWEPPTQAAPLEQPREDDFAFSSSVVNQVESPSEVEIEAAPPPPARERPSTSARASGSWSAAQAATEIRAPSRAPAPPPPARVVEEDPTPQVDFDEPDEAPAIGPQDATILLGGKPPIPPSGRLEREFGVDRSAAAETIVEMGAGTARPGSWRDKQPSTRMDRPSSWGGRNDGASSSTGDRFGSRSGLGAVAPMPGSELAPGDSFGAFKILEVQERRDLGRVYKAHDLDLDRVVILKVLPENAADANARRITSQIETLAGLDHPNVMSVYNGGTHAGSKYFTLEFIAGRALAEYVRDEVPPPEKALSLIREVAGAVEYAHRKGLVHETLSPEDVRVDEAANPHLVGFWRSGADDGTNLAALGRLLYLALTGVDPEESTRGRRNIVPPDQLDPRIPSEVADLCLRALSKDPDDRFTGAAALVQEIDKCARGLRPSVRRRRGGAAGRSLGKALPILYAAIGIALLGGIGYGVYRFASGGEAQADTPEPEAKNTDDPKKDPSKDLAKDPKKDPPKDPPKDPVVRDPDPKGRNVAKLSITTPTPGCTVELVQIDPTTYTRGKAERIGKTPIAERGVPQGNYLVEVARNPSDPERLKFPITVRESAYGQVEEIKIDYPAGQPEDMVYVPKGQSSPASTTGSIPSFFIDEYPVTNEQYAKFLQATGHPAPAAWRGRVPTAAERQPVTGISINDAWCYALWAGKRLPRSREYQKAMTGSDGRRFPWGKNHEGVSGLFRLIGDIQQASPIAIGLYPKAESPYGCQDMVGNVLVYLHEAGDQSGYPLGGALFTTAKGPNSVLENVRLTSDPTQGGHSIIGFRCARSDLRATTLEEFARLAAPGNPAEDRITALHGIYQIGQRAAFDRLIQSLYGELTGGDEYVRYAAAYYAGRVPGVDALAEIRRLMAAADSTQRTGLTLVLSLLRTAESTQLLREIYPALDGEGRLEIYAVLRERASAAERYEMALGELSRGTHAQAIQIALADLSASTSTEYGPLVRRYVEEHPLPPGTTQAESHHMVLYILLLRLGEIDLFLEKLFSPSALETLVAAHALRHSGTTIPFGDALSALECTNDETARLALVQYHTAAREKLTVEQMGTLEARVASIRAAATSPELQKACDALLEALRAALKRPR